jgi:hypothetical protein
MACTDVREVVSSHLEEDGEAVAGTVSVVHEERAGRDAVFAVRFVDVRGNRRVGLVGLRRHGGAWHPSGGYSSNERPTERARPWIAYGGWGTGSRREHAALGGWVSDPRAVRARIIDRVSQRVLTTRVEGGVAIFLWRGDLDMSAADVALLDAEGRVLVTGPMRSARTA